METLITFLPRLSFTKGKQCVIKDVSQGRHKLALAVNCHIFTEFLANQADLLKTENSDIKIGHYKNYEGSGTSKDPGVDL